MRWDMSFARLSILMTLAACSPQEPAETAATPPANPEAPPSPEAPPDPGPTEIASSEPAPAEPAAPPEPSLHELCDRVCEKVKEKCSGSVVERCAVNCDQYDKVAPPCEPVTREALTCAASAPDLPCANVAPESCARSFQRMATCQRAPESFADSETPGEQKSLPSGWARLEPAGEGFVAPMPDGVQKAEAAGEESWSVQSSGVTYFVRKLPPPAEKFTPKSQVRLAMQWLAPCNLGLKLHGQVDDADRTSVHFDVGCKSGTERHGVLHITKDALFIVGVEAPPGERGEFDAFVYGFEVR